MNPVMAEEISPSRITTVIGKALLEKRATVVPMAICESLKKNMPCPKSEPYWALVVEHESVRYEVDYPFDLGREEAPAGVEIQGTWIEPGARVALEGQVRPLTEKHHLVSDIQEARVLSESRMWTMSPVWKCRNPESSDEEPRIQVEVWQIQTSAKDRHFDLKVWSADEQSWRQLAQIENARVIIGRDQVSFRGKTLTTDVVLDLDQTEQAFDKVPASLRLQKLQVGPASHFPLQIRESMICDRAALGSNSF